jgi:hypothetical protein
MRLARPQTQHGYHHAPKVKPEAATAVDELLMMGVRTPKTFWAVNKRQDNKLEKLLHLVGDLFELKLLHLYTLFLEDEYKIDRPTDRHRTRT